MDDKKSSLMIRSERLTELIGDKLSKSEIMRLAFECRGEAESASVMTEDEANGVFGNTAGYTPNVMTFAGEIDIIGIMKRYAALMTDEPLLRTNYFRNDLSRSVKVTFKPHNYVFPITNAADLSDSRYDEMLQKGVLADTRKSFDPHFDCPLKLRGFIRGDNTLTVIISVRSEKNSEEEARKYASVLFEGLELKSAMTDISGENALSGPSKSLDRWKEEFEDVAPKQFFPGYRDAGPPSAGRSAVTRYIGRERNGHIIDFCRKNKRNRIIPFLMAWAELIGRYNDIGSVTAVLCKDGLCPVVIRRGLKSSDRIADVTSQIEQFSGHRGYSCDELHKSTGMSVESVLAVHAFPDSVSNVSSMTRDAGKAPLMLIYKLVGDSPNITYLYAPDSVYYSTVDTLHELFMSLIDEFISDGNKRVDIWKALRLSGKDESELKKMREAEKALYLRKSGLFGSRSVEELMPFAERARLTDYSADDVMLEDGQPCTSFALVVSGKVEESKIGAGKTVKSVRILSAGSVIGIRALFDNNISVFTYSAVGDGTKLLWINRDEFYSFAGAYPQSWAALLETVNAEADRMKKLWTIM